jgi:hypothetical protein
MSIQSEINRVNNNVQTTLNTIAETGVSVGSNSDALPAAAAALANEKEDKILKVAVTLLSSAWTEGDEAFEQTVSVAGGTANTLIALQPTVSQILALQSDGVTALMVDNDSGTFIAKAVAAAPSADMTIQCTLTEVSE